jgi:hypothetical protein
VSIRARYKLEIGISSTSAEDRDLGNHLWEVIADSPTEGGSRRTKLPAGSVDVELSMADIAVARFLAIRTEAVDPNQDPVAITIKRNTVGNEAIEIAPVPDTKEGYLLLTTSTGLTAIFASNPGTVDMNVTCVVGGD